MIKEIMEYILFLALWVAAYYGLYYADAIDQMIIQLKLGQ